MAISKAEEAGKFVVECSIEGCGAKETVEANDSYSAAEEAFDHKGWGVSEYAMGLYTYCPAHKQAYHGLSPIGRRIMNGGAWE